LQILNTLEFGQYQKAIKPPMYTRPKWESCYDDEWNNKNTTEYYYRKTPWYNHPAVKMWRGKRIVLIDYAKAICDEWKKRGFKDTVFEKCRDYYLEHLMGLSDKAISERTPPPPWLGNQDFHASHRSNLLRKNRTHYSQFGWTEPSDLPYIWPV
jgi:Pyrimidine dimer DNA glycosylase